MIKTQSKYLYILNIMKLWWSMQLLFF